MGSAWPIASSFPDILLKDSVMATTLYATSTIMRPFI